MFLLIFANYTGSMNTNPYFITKDEGLSNFHIDLCLDVFTTGRPVETLRLHKARQ